jgi:hypothetical protein
MTLTEYQKKEVEYFSALFMYLAAKRDRSKTNNKELLDIFVANPSSSSSSNGTSTEVEPEETQPPPPPPAIQPRMNKGKIWIPAVTCIRLDPKTGKYNTKSNDPDYPNKYYHLHKNDFKPCEFCKKPVKNISISKHIKTAKCKRIAALLNSD